MPRPAPKVAAVHDLSGFGRCSLTVILPVLSAMGLQCCPILAAYLSTHMGFPPSSHAVFLDMSDQLKQTVAHWAELGLSFQAIYSGFLSSERQIDSLEALIGHFRTSDTLVLVDPVMGDHGKPYRTYTPQLCRRMADLAEQADLITPNLTEAAILLGEDYHARPTDEAGTALWLERLSLDGRRSVVLTGVSFQEGLLGAGWLDRKGGSVQFSMARREPGSFGGTGDLFAAVLLGSLLGGHDLAASAEAAVQFVARCVAHTLALGTPPVEGVQFEPLLGELMAPWPRA